MTKPPTRRILVVEDHDSSREAVRTILDVMGYEVATAATIAEGLAALEPPPDCILLDLMLPDGRGEAILERVLAEGLPCRVIVCTGDYDPDRLAAVRTLGADSVLLKPLSLSHLVAAC